MPNLAKILSIKFQNATAQAFPSIKLAEELPVEITQSTQQKFGHYQFNSAMKLAGPLKKNPRALAEEILGHVDKNHNSIPMIASMDVAGPGFINIKLDTDFLEDSLNRMLSDPSLGTDKLSKRERIVIDFSSPNIAKEMHVGHLRSTIIGDALARCLEFQGHDVLRLNHIGDWGTSFGMLIAYMKQEKKEIFSQSFSCSLNELMQWYRAAKKLFDEDPNFKKKSQLEVVNLQSGQKDALRAWNLICEISKKAYHEIYSLLDVHLIDRGESCYNSKLHDIVSELEKKQLVTLSDDAKCLFLNGFQNREGDPLPLIIQKSDGGYNYATTDLAAINQRIFEEKAERIIYVTDLGQQTHFQMIFSAANKAGWLDHHKVRLDHVGFGLVLGGDGKKFKTRKGDVEPLIDLIIAAIDRAEEILKEKNPEMHQVERKKLSHILGIGAIKYADLSCNRTSDYTFSYDRMLKFEGNTAAFLMYAYVRILGIKRKACIQNLQKLTDQFSIQINHPAEISLGLHLLQFAEAIDQMADDLMPNRLTDYLYHLAEKFHVFFRDCQVVGAPEQNSRLLLCELVLKIMQQGLEILGVKVPEKM